MNRTKARSVSAGTLIATAVCLALASAAIAYRFYTGQYEQLICLGVHVRGVPLGGLTVEEAAAKLESEFPDPAGLPLTLRDGDQVWTFSWADLELRFDPQASASVAFQTGREGSVGQRLADLLRALLLGRESAAVIVLPDENGLRVALEGLAPQMELPAQRAGLVVGPDGVVPLPPEPGRALEVEATIAGFAESITPGAHGLTSGVVTRLVDPPFVDVSTAQAQAETLLAQPFTLLVADPLTDFNASWAVGVDELAGWLVAVLKEDDLGTRLQLQALEEPILLYVASLGEKLAEGLAVNTERTVDAISAALESGQSQAYCVLVHEPSVYLVRLGDTFTSIARAHGFPVWRLAQANPDVEMGALQVGQQLIIPSIDVLFPLPVVTSQRVVVDISHQHLYAYEEDSLVFDYVCSTGIASSPTTTGTFQVLSRESTAYASVWDLWMPHFLGIYESGPDFVNGIHGLPTLSSGEQLWAGYLGQPISYGCIVLGIDDATALYDWVQLGTLVGYCQMLWIDTSLAASID
ncbi:MAG: LysM peptidoglycan-binding domain-containing protein, partial [Anaerolineales bacterium]